MRDIKFRAWDGEFMYLPENIGDDFDFSVSPDSISLLVNEQFHELGSGVAEEYWQYVKKDADVMQFTETRIGDVEIYDGDILSFDWRYQSGELYADDCKSIIGVVSHCGGRFTVSFFDGAMQFDLHEINQNTFERFWKAEYNSAKDEFFKMNNFKVVGNIYENIELLD